MSPAAAWRALAAALALVVWPTYLLMQEAALTYSTRRLYNYDTRERSLTKSVRKNLHELMNDCEERARAMQARTTSFLRADSGINLCGRKNNKPDLLMALDRALNCSNYVYLHQKHQRIDCFGFLSPSAMFIIIRTKAIV